MPTEAKAQVIERAKEWYSKSAGVVFTDYRGLKNKELQVLRANLRAKGGEFHIVKNTLFRIAAGDDATKLPDTFHNGTTAVAFIYENESECAKSIFDFVKSSKKLEVKGGMFGGKVFDAKQVEALSKLPSKDVLISQIIGLVASPISNLVGVIEALYADPIRVIGAVADKVAEGAPAPAKSEVSAVAEPAAEAAATESAPEAEAPADAPTADAAPAEEAAAPEEGGN